jgi:hypothetical protein
MATQILRTVDRWRFEAPLALALAVATGFATLAMPYEIFVRLPVAGRLGIAGHIGLAVALAIVCGGIGYVAMRRPAKSVPGDEDIDLDDDIDAPSGLTEDRLLRLRRADRHPDAPPRAPIRASRDLGEPFMDVGTSVPAPDAEPQPAPEHGPAPVEATAADLPILDGDYVEVAEPDASTADADAAPEMAAEHRETEPVVDARSIDACRLGAPFIVPPVGDDMIPAPAIAASDPAPMAPPATTVAPRHDASIAAMTERLSAGMARRAGRSTLPVRDMRPALRDALEELNRLAARRG